MLQPHAISGRHRHRRMQIEAVEVGVHWAGRSDFGGVAVTAHTLRWPASAPPSGDPTDDSGSPELRVQRTVERPLVGRLRLAAGILQVNAVARHQPHDPTAHRYQQARHLAIAGRRRGHEAPATFAIVDEHALRDQAVEVHIQIERRAKALDRRHRTSGAVPNPAPLGTPTLEAEHGANEDGQHREAEMMIPGEGVAQAVRQGQDPLAHPSSVAGYCGGRTGRPPES
jgi:hypothetical protein